MRTSYRGAPSLGAYRGPLIGPSIGLNIGDAKSLGLGFLMVSLLVGCESDSTGPGSPTLTELVEGDQQTAFVDQAVAARLSMRVTDSDGIPVPDVEVTFSVTIGGGVVEGPDQRTDENGVAAPTAWWLGPTPGRNQLMGEVPGLAPIFFEATALADSRGAFVIVAGNNQSGRVQEAVAVAPQVELTDGDGNPVAGRAVQFAVVSGGGQVQGANPITDAQGRAEVGAWILGDTLGEQRLEARTPELPTLTFRATAVTDQEPVVMREEWITDIGRPWDLAFLPDGTMLISERHGRIRAAAPGAMTTRVILEPPDDLVDRGQTGLLGIAVDPDFSTNRFVYSFLASDRTGQVTNHIRRWRLSNDGRQLVEDDDILTGITWGAGGAHSGGRIRFGPDGYLWITTGDTRSPTVPQDVTEMGGKVLRITRDGAPAPGNPDYGPNARPELYFVGVRNVQGIAFRPGTGQPYICEHGPNEHDEVTAIQGGANGGWNPNDGDGNYNGYTGALMSDPSIPNVVQPIYRTAESAGMCGCDFLRGPQWGAWDGALMVGMLAGNRALILSLDSAGTGLEDEVDSVLEEGQRIRSVVMGPDGSAYLALDDDSGVIWRVWPQ